MNKEEILAARLNFELNRKTLLLRLTEKTMPAVKSNGTAGHKCQESRNDFSYIRAMTEVKIGNLLKRSNKRISGKRLKEATKKVVENESTKGVSLSA